jgi:hypothetical protein
MGHSSDAEFVEKVNICNFIFPESGSVSNFWIICPDCGKICPIYPVKLDKS